MRWPGRAPISRPKLETALAWIRELTYLVPANLKLLTLIRKLAEESR